jgi:hypothetical protein
MLIFCTVWKLTVQSRSKFHRTAQKSILHDPEQKNLRKKLKTSFCLFRWPMLFFVLFQNQQFNQGPNFTVLLRNLLCMILSKKIFGKKLKTSFRLFWRPMLFFCTVWKPTVQSRSKFHCTAQKSIVHDPEQENLWKKLKTSFRLFLWPMLFFVLFQNRHFNQGPNFTILIRNLLSMILQKKICGKKLRRHFVFFNDQWFFLTVWNLTVQSRSKFHWTAQKSIVHDP